jgi:hypothetical protein
MPLPRAGIRCRGKNSTGGAGADDVDFGRQRRRWPLGERSSLKEGASSREETRIDFVLARVSTQAKTLKSSGDAKDTRGAAKPIPLLARVDRNSEEHRNSMRGADRPGDRSETTAHPA